MLFLLHVIDLIMPDPRSSRCWNWSQHQHESVFTLRKVPHTVTTAVLCPRRLVSMSCELHSQLSFQSVSQQPPFLSLLGFCWQLMLYFFSNQIRYICRAANLEEQQIRSSCHACWCQNYSIGSNELVERGSTVDKDFV